jgi:hypothetical protein
MRVLRWFDIRHKVVQNAAIAIYFLVLTGFLLQLQSRLSLSIPQDDTDTTGLTRRPAQKPLVKPENVTVSGFVFYGRKSRVSSMRCYLEVSIQARFKFRPCLLIWCYAAKLGR